MAAFSRAEAGEDRLPDVGVERVELVGQLAADGFGVRGAVR